MLRREQQEVRAIDGVDPGGEDFDIAVRGLRFAVRGVVA